MTQKSCRICLKTPLAEYDLGEKNGYKFVACKDCGSVVTEPWPTLETLDQFYGEIQPEVVHVPGHDREIGRVGRAITALMPNGMGKKFLDVNSRQGYAVMAAKKLGFNAHGISPHSFFTSFAKDRYDAALFENVSLMDYAARGETADFVYLAEGFCEQTDLEAYAAALAKVVAPGGKILLREPDGNHIRLPAHFPKWSFAYPPMNFCYVSKKGMTLLLGRHGLRVEKKFLTWSPFMRMIVTRA